MYNDATPIHLRVNTVKNGDHMYPGQIRRIVKGMMPGVIDDLKDLVRIPSVSFTGYPPESVYRMAGRTKALLESYGFRNVQLIDIPDDEYPAVYGEIPPPQGAPTILMYAHYDVQPAPPAQGWKTDPWMPVEKAGRLFGRGTADDKSGILLNAASVKVFDGNPPVGVKVLVEGKEETAGHLRSYVKTHPGLFLCDAFVVADSGNLGAGEPVLCTTLRGEAACDVTVRTLELPVHSGSFGGPAPDAFVALTRMLATLHDEHGNPAVPGLQSGQWKGTEYPEPAFRRTSGMLDGVDLIGSGSISSRLWSKPSITVIGIDAPAIAGSSNVLIPVAWARISMRVSPGADASKEARLLVDHLHSVSPWHVQVEVENIGAADGFICPTGGLVYAAAKRAMKIAFGKPAGEAGAGGSIPLLHALKEAVPDAEFVIWGCADLASSRIHGPDESVDIGELERMIVAQALLLNELGARGTKRDLS